MRNRLMQEAYEDLVEQLKYARVINDLLYTLALEQQKGERVCLRDETQIQALAMLDTYLDNAHKLLQGAANG